MIARAIILLVALGCTGGLFARRARLLARMNRLGTPIRRSGDTGRRLAREGSEVLGQRKLFQRLVPGAMHALIFWGFLVLLTTIVEAMGQLVRPGFALPLIGHARWLGLAQDVFAAGVFVGICIALWIRLVQRPERFVGSHTREAFTILGLITWIIVTLFLLKGARIA
ncbi:MAG: hypothetical protein QOI81_1865, partial [Actinomycetota bacterium]|nr:hypothetical protein [Actinomycetota bacterium]